MAKEKKTSVYSLEEAQNLIKTRKNVLSRSMEDSHVSEAVKVATLHNEEGLSEEMYAVLHTNPFLYNYKKAMYKISSIEDFFIPINKKQTIQLGSLFRSTEWKKGKKTSLIKKAFTKWKNHFNKNKTSALGKENDKLQAVGDVVTSKVSIVSFIVFVIIFIFVAFVLYKPGIFWTNFVGKSWFDRLNGVVDSMFATSWVALIAQVTFYLVPVAFIYGSIHNHILGEHQKIASDAIKVYKDSSFRIEKEFKKKFAKSRRYYLANLRRNPFQVAPLPIEKSGAGEVDLEEVERLTDAYIKKSADLKRKKGRLNFFKFASGFLVYGCGVFVFGYLLYELVKSFL